tara:strand:- start:1050 stop:1256 length:207 start_codon:yes stop_codon:yes gene_type:complete
MGNPVLDANDLKNIIFDVLDGVPALENQSEEASEFRKQIEQNSKNMEFRAAELGIDNVLVEFSSECIS